jgi:NAD(P)-dependent dehydrogenase (short-subunit alcohol dehydrogenase family)
MDLKLSRKVAIVTGGGKGCGKAYCLGFAEEGVRVVVADIDGEAAERAADEIKAKGGQALGMKVDVTKWEDVSTMVTRGLKEFGPIDILVNNAGKRGLSLVEDLTDEFFQGEVDVNLKGAVYCTKAVASQMKERRYGKIINQSSSAAITGHPYKGSIYAAAKAGLLGFSRSMARELGPFNINVNAIAPTAVNTEFLAGFSQEAIEANKKRSVFGRIAEPEDLVGVVLFLASDRSSYITGQTISIDGGQRPT